MAPLLLTKDAALREMLADLYPHVTLSGAGVALLSAQIAGLEKRCVALQDRVHHLPVHKVPRVRAHHH